MGVLGYWLLPADSVPHQLIHIVLQLIGQLHRHRGTRRTNVDLVELIRMIIYHCCWFHDGHLRRVCPYQHRLFDSLSFLEPGRLSLLLRYVLVCGTLIWIDALPSCNIVQREVLALVDSLSNRSEGSTSALDLLRTYLHGA